MIEHHGTQPKATIDLQILDYKQCFDSLWLEESPNDAFEAGLNDDHLGLLYEAGRNVKISVKTSTGISKRENIDKMIMQGGVFGSLLCSKTVDTFGKECLEEINTYTCIRVKWKSTPPFPW